MLTEAMVIKGFAYVGAWTIGTKVIGPVMGAAGTALGHGVALVANAINRKGGKNHGKKKDEANEKVSEQAILKLLKECDEEFPEEEANKEPETVNPEPKFDQGTIDWILKCRNQYGGFANVTI